ncbi:HAD family phosphatase [Cereibacter sp. SYSU M97828]|nr:HAD family phosphatase [Cereibacter flavus]
MKALLFDLDGTLTHTDPIHLRALQHLLGEHGLTMDEAMYRDQISGRSNAEVGRHLFPDRDDHAELLSRKEALFRDYAADLVPLAGAADLIAAARRGGLGLALVTNAPRANVDHMLAAIGLDGAFDTIVHGDEMDRPKPDPLPYLTALDRLGATASEALAFEDSIPGIRAAVAAGIRTIGIATTLGDADLRRAGAAFSVTDFHDPRIAF